MHNACASARRSLERLTALTAEQKLSPSGSIWSSRRCTVCGHVNEFPIAGRACARCGVVSSAMKMPKGWKLVLVIAGGIVIALAMVGWAMLEEADCPAEPCLFGEGPMRFWMPRLH